MIKEEKRKPLLSLMPYMPFRKKVWDLFSKCIRIEEGRCFTCRRPMRWQEMDAGHFVHKKSMDFVRKNIHAQCVTCNRWKHGHLGEYAYMLVEKYGQDILSELRVQGNKTKRYTREELEEIYTNCQKWLKELESKHEAD